MKNEKCCGGRKADKIHRKEGSSLTLVSGSQIKLDCYIFLKRLNVSYNEVKYYKEFITFAGCTIKCHA